MADVVANAADFSRADLSSVVADRATLSNAELEEVKRVLDIGSPSSGHAQALVRARPLDRMGRYATIRRPVLATIGAADEALDRPRFRR